LVEFLRFQLFKQTTVTFLQKDFELFSQFVYSNDLDSLHWKAIINCS